MTNLKTKLKIGVKCPACNRTFATNASYGNELLVIGQPLGCPNCKSLFDYNSEDIIYYTEQNDD